jgi:acetolactate synthase-1/2/3 large subunit
VAGQRAAGRALRTDRHDGRASGDGHFVDDAPTISGGRAVVEALLAAGVTHAFCVPGESFMGVLDAMHAEPAMRVVTARHEAGAAFMAVGYARLTGRPAVCMGTRMVGAANLSIGIHTAYQDSVPLVAILGQTPTEFRHREAFQEVELDSVFAPLTKWALEVPSADRVGELTLKAARVAIAGRPGPVALVLREELTQALVRRRPMRVVTRSTPGPDAELVERSLSLLRDARRPILLIGGGVIAADATELCVRFAETEQIPVVTAWRRPDAFPNDHPLYLGWSGLRSPATVLDRIRNADVVMAVGTRLSEFTSYRYQIPAPDSRFIHADICAEVLGAHVGADVACQTDARHFLQALLDRVTGQPIDEATLAERSERNRDDRAAWEAQTTPTRGRARTGFVDQQAVTAHLRELLPTNTVTVTDGGNFAGWPARFLRWNEPRSFLGPTSGAMGYAIPASIGAKLARPDRPVVTFVGDGGYMMTGMELETAVREATPFVALVYDNQQYGTIKMHQVHDYPAQLVGTTLGPIDFAALARSLGGVGISVRDDSEFPAAFREALANGRPTVLHLRVDPEQLYVGDEP